VKPVARLICAAVLLTTYYCWLFPRTAPAVSAAALSDSAIVSDIEASGAAFAAGRYDEALAPTVRLTEKMPSQAMYFGRLATIQQRLGKRADEARSLEAMFAVSPTPWDACPWLPQAYEAIKDEARALNAYERCAEVDPESPDALLFLGRAYNAAGRPADARRTLEKAVAISPQYPDLHLLLGVRNFADDRVLDARQNFERFLELAPGRREEVAVWLQRTGAVRR
jgi:tetratricopeptide (TPR) repeat protein